MCGHTGHTQSKCDICMCINHFISDNFGVRTAEQHSGRPMFVLSRRFKSTGKRSNKL